MNSHYLLVEERAIRGIIESEKQLVGMLGNKKHICTMQFIIYQSS